MFGPPESKDTHVKNVLVIFPVRQLYLPEFDAFGMMNSFRSYVVTESEDVRSKITREVKVMGAEFRALRFGGILTYSFSFLKNLKSIIARVGPEVVFTYESYSTFSYQVAKLSRRLGFKHVVVSYETIPASKALWGVFPPTRLFHNVVREKAGHFLALSNRVKDSLVASGIGEAKITTFYPGIGIPSILSKPRHSAQVTPFRILFMGRLRPNKGIATLLRAFALLAEQGLDNVELVVAGDGPLVSVVRDAARRSRQVRYEGFVYGKRKLELLDEADVFIYPSEDQIYPFGLKRWEEQTAAAVREAMAFGLPVIVSDSGSLPELVGRSDIVFRQRNAKELSQKITRVYSSQKFRDELRQFNQDRCRALFGMPEFARALEDLIKRSVRYPSEPRFKED